MAKNILIIEDDENLAEALSDFLLGSGYETSHASTLSQTMNVLRTSDISLIILDVHLGSEDGYTLCREIRATYDTPLFFLQKSGDIVYDKRSRQFSRNHIPLDLTLTEQRLACCLMEQALSTVTREHLFYQVWDKYNAYVDSNTLNVNMSRLREKLGEWQGAPYIQTVRGLGYRWTVPLKK